MAADLGTTATTALPIAMAAPISVTMLSSGGASGQNTTTTPQACGIVKLWYGPATEFWHPRS